PDAAERVGLWAPLRELSGADRSAAGIPQPLQLQATTRLARPPGSGYAAEQPGWELQLDGGAAARLFLRDAEGGTAATRGDDVRVVHLEAAAHQRLRVVDLGAVNVREARLVDDHLDAV